MGLIHRRDRSHCVRASVRSVLSQFHCIGRARRADLEDQRYGTGDRGDGRFGHGFALGYAHGASLARAAADEEAVRASVDQVLDERLDARGGQGAAVVGERGDERGPDPAR